VHKGGSFFQTALSKPRFNFKNIREWIVGHISVAAENPLSYYISFTLLKRELLPQNGQSHFFFAGLCEFCFCIAEHPPTHFLPLDKVSPAFYCFGLWLSGLRYFCIAF